MNRYTVILNDRQLDLIHRALKLESEADSTVANSEEELEELRALTELTDKNDPELYPKLDGITIWSD